MASVQDWTGKKTEQMKAEDVVSFIKLMVPVEGLFQRIT